MIPLESSDDVVTRAKAFERADVRLAGERKMLPIPGFDLGNSPREFTREAVEGKTVLHHDHQRHAGASLALQGARDVVVASYVNFTAVLAMLRAALRGGADITIVCAGRDRQFALEDAGCAGRYVYNVSKRLTGDRAQRCGAGVRADRSKVRRQRRCGSSRPSEHGRALRDAGFGDDLAACAAVDSLPSHPAVPGSADHQARTRPGAVTPWAATTLKREILGIALLAVRRLPRAARFVALALAQLLRAGVNVEQSVGAVGRCLAQPARALLRLAGGGAHSARSRRCMRCACSGDSSPRPIARG